MKQLENIHCNTLFCFLIIALLDRLFITIIYGICMYHKNSKYCDTNNNYHNNCPKIVQLGLTMHVCVQKMEYNGKQCRLWSECSFRSILIRVCSVCLYLSVPGIFMVIFTWPHLIFQSSIIYLLMGFRTFQEYFTYTESNISSKVCLEKKRIPNTLKCDGNIHLNSSYFPKFYFIFAYGF